MIPLFDLDKIHRHRQTAAVYQCENFLAQSIEYELVERLYSSNQQFDKVLINGARTNHFDKLSLNHDLHIHHINAYHQSLQKPYEHVSSQSQNYDVIIDSLKIHTINDVHRYLQVNKDRLNPGGILLAAFYGGETLRELRQSLLNAELKLYQGAALRIVPMIDIETTLRLLVHAGFDNPIVDREIITIEYTSLSQIFDDIKIFGENSPFIDSPKAITYSLFKETSQCYLLDYATPDGKLKVTAEVIYFKCLFKGML